MKYSKGIKVIRFAVFTVLAAASVLYTSTVKADDDNVFRSPDHTTAWTVIGPSGGDVRSVAVDPRDKDRLYISTLDGQIHTSSDGGKTWRMLVNFDRPQLTLDQLFVDSRDSNIIYASGHRGVRSGGFFKSTDKGATWKEAKELSKESIHAMTQAESDPNYLFVGTKNGIFVSKDSGDHWERLSSESMPLDINSMAVDPRSTNTIYAGTTWRPYKSTDAGKTWRLIKDGIIDDSDVFAIDINRKDPMHIIASACSGIYETLNGGEKWRKIQGIPSQARRTRDILQHPSRPGTIYAATTEGFWMSSNAGATWTATTQRNVEVNSIAVHPEEPNRVFIATNNFGVLVSNDSGKTFAPANENFTSRFTYSVVPDSERQGRIYATTQNTASSGGFVFTSSDDGRNWTQAKGIDINKVSPFTILQDRINPDRLYLGTNVGVFLSTDRGMSWNLIETPKPSKPAPIRKPTKRMTAAQRKALEAANAAAALPKPVALKDRVRTLTYTEDDKNGLIAGTDKGLYRTYDITKGWEKLELGPGISESIFVVRTSPLLPGTIWVGTANSGLIVSKDDGATWSKTDGIPAEVPISSITVDPKRPNNIYVGTIQTLYLSRDGGRSWTRRGGNLPLGNYTSILIDPNNPDEIFVSSAFENDGGVFYSSDAGGRWQRIDIKGMVIPSRRVWAMAFDPKDPNRIYAGSHSSGVYRIQRLTPETTAAGQ